MYNYISQSSTPESVSLTCLCFCFSLGKSLILDLENYLLFITYLGNSVESMLGVLRVALPATGALASRDRGLISVEVPAVENDCPRSAVSAVVACLASQAPASSRAEDSAQ